MSGADAVKPKVAEVVDRIADDLERLSHRIHASPELAFKEERAHAWLTEFLEKHGARVERGVGGLATAFRATIPGTGTGPTIAIMAEYDALPGIGHACGHNVIATARADAGGGDDVVAARVADARQGVVLAHDGDGRAITRLQRGPEGGVDARHAALDLEALGAEELDEPAGRLDFLVAELGMVVDLAGELLQLIARPVQRAGDLILDGAHARTSVGVSGPAHYTPSVVWYLPPREPWSRAGDRDSSDLRERTGRARTHP